MRSEKRIRSANRTLLGLSSTLHRKLSAVIASEDVVRDQPGKVVNSYTDLRKTGRFAKREPLARDLVINMNHEKYLKSVSMRGRKGS